MIFGANRKRVKPVSDQRRDEHYPEFVQNYLAWHRVCEVNRFITMIDPTWRGCRRQPGGLHHLRKRSASGALTNPANVLASCNPCNQWVEDHPVTAHAVGLVIREGDPEWDALGRRVWAHR